MDAFEFPAEPKFRPGTLALYRAAMDEHGWALANVQDVDGVEASYVHTVGLLKWGHPELVMYGTTDWMAATVLNRMGEHVRAGRAFTAGETIGDGIGGQFELVAIAVADSSLDLELANQFFRTGDPVPALQVVWPDEQHRFPWDPGYALPASVQPLAGPGLKAA